VHKNNHNNITITTKKATKGKGERGGDGRNQAPSPSLSYIGTHQTSYGPKKFGTFGKSIRLRKALR